MARNVIVHYRASGHELPAATRHEIDSRWMDRILAADQQRHPWPLAEPREVTDRVQGCCRDHTLFCVSVLRAHGIPARSRVGFAGYFTPGWHHDHVIVEAWLEGRWQSFDAEVDAPWPTLPTPLDMSLRDLEGTGFATAARVWSAYRDGDLDPDTYGVDPNVPDLRGRRFLFDEVIYEIAHRFGDELLLWDGWGRITGAGCRGHRGGRRLARRRSPRSCSPPTTVTSTPRPAHCRATGPTPGSTPGRRSCRRRRSATRRSTSPSREADRS